MHKFFTLTPNLLYTHYSVHMYIPQEFQWILEPNDLSDVWNNTNLPTSFDHGTMMQSLHVFRWANEQMWTLYNKRLGHYTKRKMQFDKFVELLGMS